MNRGEICMKLLIIEDEADLRNALCKGFTKKGYLADTAADGNEGYELAFINKYDLILLDLNLPGMDGLTLLQKIRENDLRQKILILSARSAYEQRIEGLDLGANDYLVKPFDFGELEARVPSAQGFHTAQYGHPFRLLPHGYAGTSCFYRKGRRGLPHTEGIFHP